MKSTVSLESRSNTLWRGARTGLMPLVVLIVLVVLSLVFTALMQAITRDKGPSTEGTAVVLSMTVGLLIALFASIVTLVRAWKRMNATRKAGDTAQASGILWGLTFTSLVVLLPALLAIVLTQHPAP